MGCHSYNGIFPSPWERVVCPRSEWPPAVIRVHAQKIKFTSNTEYIDFHEASGASSTPLPAKTAEIIKSLPTQTPSPKQIVHVKLFPNFRTGIGWTAGISLGLLM